ncbi:MAG: hypothetical protein IJX88_06075 [Clostridia bacterium]|nr:hypothetical protein [Clostridia bacterium]
MQVDKIVVRALLSTLAAILVLCGFMTLMLCFVFPSSMMHITYDLGMDQSSVNNARRAYNRTDEIYYIAFATEVAIGSDNYAEIEKCGDRFIADEEFAVYCNAKDKEGKGEMSYAQYVYSQVCIAKYNLGKKTQAVDKAFALVGESFPENNAVVAVLVTALRKGDTDTAQKVATKMTERRQSIPEADKTYFEEILGLVQNG